MAIRVGGREATGKIPIGLVRSYETSRVRTEECFLPGDVIRARVVGKEKREWTLSTAEEELGVVLAFSAATGQPLVPLNWEFVACPVSKFKEPRKVAKPEW